MRFGSSLDASTQYQTIYLEIQYSLSICSKAPALGLLRTIPALAIFFPPKRQNILTYVRQRSVFAKFVLQLEKELVRRCGMCA